MLIIFSDNIYIPNTVITHLSCQIPKDFIRQSSEDILNVLLECVHHNISMVSGEKFKSEFYIKYNFNSTVFMIWSSGLNINGILNGSWVFCFRIERGHMRQEVPITLRWRHNERNGVSNHRPHACLRNCLFRRRLKKKPKLRVTGVCEGNSPVTREFPAQRAITRKMFPFDDLIMSRLKFESALLTP